MAGFTDNYLKVSIDTHPADDNRIVPVRLLSIIPTDMGDSNIIPLYILVVLAISVLTSSPIYGISASILSVFVFNWFFTEPKYTLRVIDNAYFVTFLVMFVSALLTSSLTVRLKDYARHAAQNSYRTQVLLDTSQQLQQV